MADSSQQTMTMVGRSENMQVAVRLRPMTERERQKGNKRIVEIEQNTVQLMNPKHTHDRYKKFTFDYSYWSYDGFKRNPDGVWVPDMGHPNGINYVDQERVFHDLGQFLLDNAIAGYHSALLAYGQTGSGKSYTVSGYGANEGILPRFARAIYIELDKCTIPRKQMLSNAEKVDKKQPPGGEQINYSLNQRYEVYFSMIEIYNEVVRDLLPGGGQANSAGASGAAGSDEFAGEPGATPSRAANQAGASATPSASFSGRGLKIREHPVHGFFVENMSSYICRNKEEIESRIEEGQLNKSIAATRMNETSSRGHTIYEFRIKQYKLKPDSAKQKSSATRTSAEVDGPEMQAASYTSGDEIVTTSVVQLVDLAGSERMAVHVPEEMQAGNSGVPGPAATGAAAAPRTAPDGSRSSSNAVRSSGKSTSQNSSSMRPNNSQSKHNSNQQRFKESVSINQSLSALGNCIQVMSQNSQQLTSNEGSHTASSGRSGSRGAPIKIPYRDSALTKLLNRCCLSGNSKVVIIATLSPADTHFDDTLSTLRFADRAKQIRTHATINQTSRRASLADGGSLGLLGKGASSRLQQLNNRKLRQINESELSSDSGSAGNKAGNSSMATPTRNRGLKKGVTTTTGAGGSRRANQAGKADANLDAASRLASSRSNPSLAKMTDPRQQRSRGANKGNAINKNKYNYGDESVIRKSRSEHMLAMPDQNDDLDNDFNGEEDEYINDLGDLRDGFISPESDDSMAALADEDLSTGEKIEILNRMLNNSGPTERILAIQEETEPSAMSMSLDAAGSKSKPGAQIRRSRTNKLRAEMKQVSLISSTLKKTNPYITNLNPDEQLSGVLSYMIKEGETIVGKGSQCDVVIHGTEIRGQHAKISRPDKSTKPIYIEPIMSEIAKDGGRYHSQQMVASSVNIRVNGYPVMGRIELQHCDRILFGTNSYFVFANLSDKISSETKVKENDATHRVADLDLITYEMAKSEVLRVVMQEGQNNTVIKEINDYTHRPGTGKFKKSDSDQQQQQQQQQQVNRLESKDTVHKLTRSLTIKNSSTEEGGLSRDDAEDDDTSKPYEDDEMYRKQLMEDTYDFVIPVTEVNAIAAEMGIKVQFELKIVNGEEQLSQHAYDRYYDSNTFDAFSSSSIGDDNDQQQQGRQQQINGRGPAGGSITSNNQTNSAGRHSNGSGSSASGMGGTQTGANSQSSGYLMAATNNQNAAANELGEMNDIMSPGNPDSDVTYLMELHELDIPPALYVRVHLTEFDISFYWQKEKFQARRYKMLELYGPWSYGGKAALVEYLIEQSRTQGNYLIDPFIDDPHTNLVLIGHAQITLQPIAHLTDKRQNYDIVNINDETVGSIDVEAIPCHYPESGVGSGSARSGDIFKPFTGEDLATRIIENPSELLGRPLVFMLKIISCNDLLAKYSNIFCQYSFGTRNPIIRTRSFYHEDLATNDEGDKFKTIEFNHSHFICFESVSEDLLDFLKYGFLTIQVVGQHLIPKTLIGHSPTMITTIINSINKYKFKIEQASNFGSANYSNGDYFLDSAHSSNKEITHNGDKGLGSQMGSASMASNSAKTINMYDQNGADFDENGVALNGNSQENIIDMILTKRKLDRAENQLHYLKRTVNIAEHYNKKHIPIKVVKKLLNSYGQEVDGTSIEETGNNEAATQPTGSNKKSGCVIQ